MVLASMVLASALGGVDTSKYQFSEGGWFLNSPGASCKSVCTVEDENPWDSCDGKALLDVVTEADVRLAAFEAGTRCDDWKATYSAANPAVLIDRNGRRHCTYTSRELIDEHLILEEDIDPKSACEEIDDKLHRICKCHQTLMPPPSPSPVPPAPSPALVPGQPPVISPPSPPNPPPPPRPPPSPPPPPFPPNPPDYPSPPSLPPPGKKPLSHFYLFLADHPMVRGIALTLALLTVALAVPIVALMYRVWSPDTEDAAGFDKNDHIGGVGERLLGTLRWSDQPMWMKCALALLVAIPTLDVSFALDTLGLGEEHLGQARSRRWARKSARSRAAPCAPLLSLPPHAGRSSLYAVLARQHGWSH